MQKILFIDPLYDRNVILFVKKFNRFNVLDGIRMAIKRNDTGQYRYFLLFYKSKNFDDYIKFYWELVDIIKNQ